MTARQKEFLLKLADLIEEYTAEISYTTDDDGVHVVVDGRDIYHGFGPDPQEMRAVIKAR